jgi:crotonobetainyl-CoA:carnitine CoA-transferase CaiB-like acyl-CoA transferase
MESKDIKDVLDKPGPLEGVKVLEYGVFHAGPGGGAILGDLGAEVIKVEADIGDPIRHWGSVGKSKFSRDGGQSPMFEFSNRNKRGLYLNIKTKKGREIFNKLVKETDVFLTNLRQSTKTELEIDYSNIASINPKVIHASVSGYGTKGPVSNVGAFDPMGQARSGMMYLTNSEEPKLLQLAILDQSTAIAFSHAIITALFVKERHGYGQEVHATLYSTALWLMHANMLLANFDIKVSELAWDRSRNLPTRNNFQCKDGNWMIGTHHPDEKFWPILCEATGQSSLIDDPRFVDIEKRMENCEELIAIFDKAMLFKSRDEWLEIFYSAGLMFSPVQQMEDVMSDVQALENDFVVHYDHPSYGKIKVPGYPIKFSKNSAGMRMQAPTIGEHTDEILSELNYSPDEIKQLRAEGIIQQPTSEDKK